MAWVSVGAKTLCHQGNTYWRQQRHTKYLSAGCTTLHQKQSLNCNCRYFIKLVLKYFLQQDFLFYTVLFRLWISTTTFAPPLCQSCHWGFLEEFALVPRLKYASHGWDRRDRQPTSLQWGAWTPPNCGKQILIWPCHQESWMKCSRRN